VIHRTFVPAPPLGDFVQDFWLYENYTQPHHLERILPSGTVELVINLVDDEMRIYDGAHPGPSRRFSGAIVSGAYQHPFVVDTAEETALVGAHFWPGGAFPFLGLPAGELRDGHVDLETLWGPAAVELRARLCEPATPEQRFRILEEGLKARLFRPLEHHYAVSTVLSEVQRSGSIPTVRDVTRSVGLSSRRLIQVFSAEVGLTPKAFFRVQRFQQVLAAVRRSGAPDWAHLAAGNGYYDQSHLIHDFVEFSGSTPSAYFQHLDHLRKQHVHIKRNHLPLPDGSNFSNTSEPHASRLAPAKAVTPLG